MEFSNAANKSSMAGGSASHHRHSWTTCLAGVVMIMTSPHQISLEEWHELSDIEKANQLLSRFYKWARINKDVTRWFYRYAKWLVRNHRPCSIKMVFERLRYESGVGIIGYDIDIKLPNDFSPLVARILVNSIEGADGIFKLHDSVVDLLEPEQLPKYNRYGSLVWTVVPDVT